MYSLSEKMLAAILALLIGFLPAQGVMAAATISPDMGMEMHQMVDAQTDNMSTTANQMNHDCEQPMSEDCCTTHFCSSCQCASCVSGIFVEFSASFNPIVEIGLSSIIDGFVSQHTSTLFRPPKV
jgi:hypothetical protein